MNETPDKIPHYYGNTVRVLFMLAAIVMLVTLPVFNFRVGLPTTVSIVSILILGLAAGLTNPKQRWDAAINMIVSAAGFFVFATYAVNSYRDGGIDRFFLTNLPLSFLFLLAVYFSVKTFRGLVQSKN